MKKTVFAIVALLFVFASIELVSLMATRYLVGKGVLYQPFSAGSYAEYLEMRDPILGWPAPTSFGTGTWDSSGSRIIPAFPDPKRHPECVSLYGDSFTNSAEVSNEDAWSNLLSIRLGCRVSNYGMGGYGTDQAFIRFHENSADDAKVVFLNHLSENILRNVNQFRALLYRAAKADGFKPRFIIDRSGTLVQIPMPDLSEEEITGFLQNPTAKYLKHEYYLPGGLSGNSIVRFPYSLSVLRAMGHFHIHAKIVDESWYKDFYLKDHASNGLVVTEEIIVAFRKEAIARGKVPVVSIIPTGLDLVEYKKTGSWVYQNLIDVLSAREIAVINHGKYIFEQIGDRDPCDLFNDCSAHFNEDGYALIADSSYEYLKANDLLRTLKD